MEAVPRLIPRRTAATVVRVVTCELPGPVVHLDDALIVLTALDASKKR